MASTTNNRYSAVLDTNPSAALATPAWSVMPMTTSTQVQLKSATAQSNVILPNGGYGGDSITSYWPEGTTSGQVSIDNSFNYTLRSIMDNAPVSKVLTAGSAPQYIAYEKSFFEGSSTFYRQARGCLHSKLDIKWDADGIVEWTSDWVGIADSRPTTMITGATYSPPADKKRLAGTDVSATITSLTTAQLKKGSISIEVNRKQQTVCGSTTAVGVGTSGYRKATVSLSFYRRDWTQETGLVVGNSTRATLITMGSTLNGFSFGGNVTYGAPMDEDDDSGQLVTLTGTFVYDLTAGTDLTITQL